MRLRRNLIAAFRLLSLRRVRAADFAAEPNDAVAVSALVFLAALIGSMLITPAPRSFDPRGFGSESVDVVIMLGLAWICAREAQRRELLLPIFVALASLFPWLWLAFVVSYRLADGATPLEESAWGFALWLGFFVWHTALVMRVFAQLSDLGALRSAALGGLYGVVVLYVTFNLPNEGYWYADDEPEESAPIAAARSAIDAEELLYAQPDRVASAIDALAPQRPGVADLYFLGFAADARQDVFRKEAIQAQQTLDARFGTAGRSLLLLNHADTADLAPLATATNLRQAITRLGRRLDPAEDMLFVFLTGHGSQEAGVATSFPRLPLNPVGPDALASMLDEAGIRWRIVVVSACHSGVFVDPLRDDASIVLTAAAAERRSFGCSADAELTYFGRALFAEALETSPSLLAGFDAARHRIYEREAREKLTHSSPQIAVGPAIAAKLAEFEALLSRDVGDLADQHAGLVE